MGYKKAINTNTITIIIIIIFFLNICQGLGCVALILCVESVSGFMVSIPFTIASIRLDCYDRVSCSCAAAMSLPQAPSSASLVVFHPEQDMAVAVAH